MRDKQYAVVEHFAGVERISGTARLMSFSAASLDILYSGNMAALDMTSPSGFTHGAQFVTNHLALRSIVFLLGLCFLH